MSDNRKNFSNVPLHNIKRSVRNAPEKPIPNPIVSPETATRSFPVLEKMVFPVLPVLFILSFFIHMDLFYWAFWALVLAFVIILHVKQAFVANARKILTSVAFVMVMITLFNYFMNTPPPAPAKPENADTINSLFSRDSSASMVEMAGQNQAALHASATPNPGAASQAQQKLEQFMSAWMNTDQQGMVDCSTPAWINKQENPLHKIFQIRANRTPTDYKIIDVSGTDADHTRTVLMQAGINKNNGSEPQLNNFQVLMIRVNDQWYVDPESIVTSQVVDAAPAALQATAAPVAVAPTSSVPKASGDTKLYYNKNGGKYYHINPNCESLAQKIKPLNDFFLYKDVSTDHFKNLIPCNICNAPLR